MAELRVFDDPEALGRALAESEENVWLPAVEDPTAYDERIDAAGGIDLFSTGPRSDDA